MLTPVTTTNFYKLHLHQLYYEQIKKEIQYIAAVQKKFTENQRRICFLLLEATDQFVNVEIQLNELNDSTTKTFWSLVAAGMY